MASRRKKTFARFGLTFVAALLLLVFREWPANNGETPPKAEKRTSETRTPATGEYGSPRSHTSKPNLELDEKSLPVSNIRDFDAAKGELRKLFSRGRDFYCGCSYDVTRRPHVDPGSCGLRSKSDRAKRIEWEHVVPASAYGRQFTAWKKGDQSCRGRNKRGRECARKVSAAFRQMEGDMYNLVPAVGELNRVRGADAFGEIPGEPREFGACDFESLAGKIEPKADIRGDIARIYFYMDARYPGFGIVEDSQKDLFERWSLADPLDEGERTRLRKIEEVQGNNFFIGRLARSGEKAGGAGRLQ